MEPDVRMFRRWKLDYEVRLDRFWAESFRYEHPEVGNETKQQSDEALERVGLKRTGFWPRWFPVH